LGFLTAIHFLANIAIFSGLIVIMDALLVLEEFHEGQEGKVLLSEGIDGEARPEELAEDKHLEEPEDISIENSC
jgi:hypothetical protein